MESNQTVIIAGGGLAGLTSAIHLSQMGVTVTLIDKAEFPKHKVCGEYISNEVRPYLDWLGVDLSDVQPVQISKIEFSTPSGRTLQSELPLGGFGVSRYALDDHLFHTAVAHGCRTISDTIVSIDFDDDHFFVTLASGQTLFADVVLGAFGKRSNLDQKMRRRFISKKSPWLAVKGHFEGTIADNVVGLHNFKGGYCGVSRVEQGRINICYLADFKTFKRYKDIEAYQKAVLYQNPKLREVFESLTPLFDKPMTISQISFDKKPCVENHVLMIGDTAGLIHPLCGNGMAIAIHSAKMASELTIGYLHGKMTRTELERKYTSHWNREFKTRLQIGRWLGRLLQMQRLSESALRMVELFPALFPKIIRLTHGKPISAPC